MTPAFAALVVDEMPQMLSLTAIPRRGAQRAVRHVEIDHEKSAGAPDRRRRRRGEDFPMHGGIITRGPSDGKPPLVAVL